MIFTKDTQKLIPTNIHSQFLFLNKTYTARGIDRPVGGIFEIGHAQKPNNHLFVGL